MPPIWNRRVGWTAWLSPPSCREGQNDRVADRVEPKRAGARRGERRKRSFDPRLAGVGVGMGLAFIAWVFLVKAAITFGRDARGGDGTAWIFLAIASVGAVACLFLSLMLGTVVLRRLGIIEERRPHKH